MIAKRSHFGNDPLYYTQSNGELFVSDSVADLMAKQHQTPSLNKKRFINEHFRTGFVLVPDYSNETAYKGIYRLEPGHELHLENGKAIQKPYWQLDPNAPEIIYKDEREYLEHFELLLNEAVEDAVKGARNVGLELSGGYDSSSIAAVLAEKGISATCFTHQNAGQERDEEMIGRERIREALPIHRYLTIGAEGFDAMAVIHECAQLFAGPSPYLFMTLANNIHKAAAKEGCDVLLSGFGGDECVSLRAFKRAYYPDMIHRKGFRQSFQQIRSETTAKRLKNARAFKNTLVNSHRFFYNAEMMFRDAKDWCRHWYQPRDEKRIIGHRAFKYYGSLREFQIAHLTGKESHQIRMRVEYCALVAKSLGFEYRYPMLYPPLIDFCLRIPYEQKMRDGRGRYLIRQFVEKHLPVFHDMPDKMSGRIMPATIEKCYEVLREGKLAVPKSMRPKRSVRKCRHFELSELIESLHEYMLHAYRTSLSTSSF